MAKEKKKIEKKDSSGEQEKLKVASEEVYCFPDYGVAIKATSREEAERKLKEILKGK